MDSHIDFNNLTHEELQKQYSKLLELYTQQREISETDAQRIHDLKRSLDTATAAEAYLAQELEELNSSLHKVEQNIQTKMEHKLEDLRIKYNRISAENFKLQQDCEVLQTQNAKLLEQLEKVSTSSLPEVFENVPEQQLNREHQLEQENLNLLEKLEEFQETTIRHTMALAEREKNIEILRDQVTCLEENMRYKREELEEATQLLKSTQEQLLESNAKIALLTAASGNNDKKGNSLFAEVDDQRQAMKQLLAAQKKSYMQMKKAYNESEYQIRRLKRENVAMHTELQTCSSIFCRSEKTYQEKLQARIRQLLNQNEDLVKKLNWTQDRLKEVATDKGVGWLGSMLDYCKQETDEIKKHLHSIRIQNASLEEQLRNSQQEMARWRFESLKSRCVLLDRENLLTENKINFKPIIAMEISISAQELESSRPRIQSVTANNTTNSLSTANIEAKLTEIENKENLQFPKVPIETIHIEDDCDIKTPLTATNNPPSILCKKRSLIPKETNKNVKFSSTECKSNDLTPENKNYSNVNATPKNVLYNSNLSTANIEAKPSFIIQSKVIKAETFENDSLLKNLVTEIENKENIQTALKENGTRIKNIKEINTSSVHNKARSFASPFPKVPIETIHIEDDCEIKTPLTATNNPSILCKNQSLIPKETNKTVKFASTECKSNDGTPANTNYSNGNSTPMKVLKKSNVIVKQIFVKSKHQS